MGEIGNILIKNRKQTKNIPNYLESNIEGKNMFPVGKINLPNWKPEIKGLSGVFCIFARYLAFQYPKSDFVKVKLFYILEFGLAPPYILKTRTDGTQ